MEEIEDPFYSLRNATDAQGIDINCSDGGGPPVVTGLTSSEVEKWFLSHPPDGDACLRILALYLPRRHNTNGLTSSRPPPLAQKVGFTQEIVEHALWNPSVYAGLAKTRAGGAASMIDEPWRFVLQTPYDDAEGPFVSLALSRHGIVIKGIYIYTDPLFEPTRVLRGERILSGWRSSGMQIISLPRAIVNAQSAWIATQLSSITATVAGIERILVEEPATSHGRDFAQLSRTLQGCGAGLIDLERRSRFETQVLDSIEIVTAKAHHGTVPWPALAPLRAQTVARGYEFEVLPRRIENARATIGNLVQQHNDAMNFATAESSRRIAEATLSESASMKAIAVLTMIFLPGTAVASFFSMAMFNWSSESGSGLASKWLWIYFVVAAPLTGLVITTWLWFSRRMARASLREVERGGRLHRVQTDLTPFVDSVEPANTPGGAKRTAEEDLEMQAIKIDTAGTSKSA